MTVCSYSQLSLTHAFFRTWCPQCMVIWPSILSWHEWIVIIMIFTKTCNACRSAFNWHKWKVPEQSTQPRLECMYFTWYALQWSVSCGMLFSDLWFFAYSLRSIFAEDCACWLGAQNANVSQSAIQFWKVAHQAIILNRTFLMSFRNASYCVIQTTYKTEIVCSRHCSVILQVLWLSC
jgi:hypothetical protein